MQVYCILRLRHWDVNNAALHGDFFERHTGDPDILFDMFRNVRARDPDVGLFLNEYNVVMNGERTMVTELLITKY